MSVRMSKDEAWQFIANAHTGILTTLRRDGMPISLPVWFAAVDGVIYVRTRGKKLQRIANDARSAFLVEDGERWSELRAVHLTGVTEIVELTPDLKARVEAEMDRKYAASRTPVEQMPAAAAAVYANSMQWTAFTPAPRQLTWDNTKLHLR